ncbi:hypothetical protein J6590_018291 [Homalodisca vitripennis]|nr:hypothetical protein J6590_018291 [Homalodisca vitripennis]
MTCFRDLSLNRKDHQSKFDGIEPWTSGQEAVALPLRTHSSAIAHQGDGFGRGHCARKATLCLHPDSDTININPIEFPAGGWFRCYLYLVDTHSEDQLLSLVNTRLFLSVHVICHPHASRDVMTSRSSEDECDVGLGILSLIMDPSEDSVEICLWGWSKVGFDLFLLDVSVSNEKDYSKNRRDVESLTSCLLSNDGIRVICEITGTCPVHEPRLYHQSASQPPHEAGRIIPNKQPLGSRVNVI